MLAAASQPNHDRQRLSRPHPWTPDIEGQAILVTPDFLPDNLRTDRAEAAGVALAWPTFGGLGRLPAQCSDGRPRIGNALERKHLAFNNAAHRALHRASNIRIIGRAARHLRGGI